MTKPILFIHGFGGYVEQYQPIIKYLKKKGCEKFYAFEYENKFGFDSIKGIAKENIYIGTFIGNWDKGGHIISLRLKYFEDNHQYIFVYNSGLKQYQQVVLLHNIDNFEAFV